MRNKKRTAVQSRKALLATVGALGTVPVASGMIGILGGPEHAPGGATTTPSVDSEYRFANVFWLAAGMLLWWTLRKPQERADATRLVLGVAASGGIARLLSVMKRGLPHPIFRFTIVLELLIVPLVILWHLRVFPRR